MDNSNDLSQGLTILLFILLGIAFAFTLSERSDLRRELASKTEQIAIQQARLDGLITGCLSK